MNLSKLINNWSQSCHLYYYGGGDTGVRAGLSGPQGEVRGHILVMVLAGLPSALRTNSSLSFPHLAGIYTQS